MTLVLVLGGARSGKSHFAEGLAHRAAGEGRAVTYVATAGPPRDAEMAARIEAHRGRRPAAWRTVEEPRALEPLLRESDGLVLVDCLTLWLTNVLLAEEDTDAAAASLLSALAQRRGTVVAVSNETGQGIVPATSLGRAFRDAQGVLNRKVAEAADHVVLVAAGCPLILKPQPAPEIAL